MILKSHEALIVHCTLTSVITEQMSVVLNFARLVEDEAGGRSFSPPVKTSEDYVGAGAGATVKGWCRSLSPATRAPSLSLQLVTLSGL